MNDGNMKLKWQSSQGKNYLTYTEIFFTNLLALRESFLIMIFET
jgi:hypothetical protein